MIATAVFCFLIAHITDKRNAYPSWVQPVLVPLPNRSAISPLTKLADWCHFRRNRNCLRLQWRLSLQSRSWPRTPSLHSHLGIWRRSFLVSFAFNSYLINRAFCVCVQTPVFSFVCDPLLFQSSLCFLSLPLRVKNFTAHLIRKRGASFKTKLADRVRRVREKGVECQRKKPCARAQRRRHKTCGK